MLSLNSVTVVGRVLFEPDRGETATGKKHMVIDVETVEDVNNKQYRQRLKVHIWGYLADKLEYLRQGDILMTQGRFQENSYEGRDGTKHKVFDVVAREVSFEPMGRSTDASRPAATGQAWSQAVAPKPVEAAPSVKTAVVDDDIPF